MNMMAISIIGNIFIRNFDTVNGVILCAKAQVVNDIEDSIGRFGDFSYDTAIIKLFTYFAYDSELPEKDDSVRAYFAIRRFPGEFWEIALHRLYPLVTANWGEYNQDMFIAITPERLHDILLNGVRKEDLC